MCGICGLVRFAAAHDGSQAARVAAMMDRLGHRGPDGSWAAGDEADPFDLVTQ